MEFTRYKRTADMIIDYISLNDIWCLSLDKFDMQKVIDLVLKGFFSSITQSIV